MSKRDYYDILGVQRTADDKALKSAYRKLAMQYHPDRNPDDAEAEKRFKEASEAYDILKDPQKRSAYDQYGHAAFEGGGGQGFSEGGFSDVFGDIFSQFMGGGRGATNRGADLRYNLEITLEDAHNGLDTTITVPLTEACSACNGTGAASPSDVQVCGECNGTGTIRMTQGFFTMERTCARCGGIGKRITKRCNVCRGSGEQTDQKTLSVSVPAGVEDGTRIRLTGKGEMSPRGGTRGDLYIYLSLKAHHLFVREGSHVTCRVPVPMTTAALGGTIEVPTIDGQRIRLDIPAGTQSGKQFRLRGKGMAQYQRPARGDMYVQATVETPTNLSKRQQDLLAEFAKDSEACSPESDGFTARVKDFFKGLAG